MARKFGIQRFAVSPGPGNAFRVELTLADMDPGYERNSLYEEVSLSVLPVDVPANPRLLELQILALQRARDLIDRHASALQRALSSS